ncbi:class I SAM-dependent methyltransferase [Uliginosibacterium sp. 31-12]|uniref:class I SAM-dependent methyltransferase n=1 Tax=Uliginosibacterium sp. 31-12 TaxID=3062781 RepID=UPI0026E1E5FF|nr:class I SAM-dependent methyltransferase [Uliginosibacterium sp. 31-12]MDO6388003.1 class I SAM-dependent methyltransferase [Uliginosibacterium sp. 31-12]
MNANLTWQEADSERTARWQSEAAATLPTELRLIDDTLPAAEAWRLVQAGISLLWRGDWQNARHLLQAMSRRADKQQSRPGKAPATALEAFRQHRAAQAARAQALARLLIEVDATHAIQARRAQDVAQACLEAYGPVDTSYVVSLRELLGVVSAHEWRKKGVQVPELGENIHAHYGVFSPLRGEYLDLIAKAPLPGKSTAFDIGTGSGVIAALLAKRGVAQIIATDMAPRALACAADNLQRLGLTNQVELLQADLFPPGQAKLIVCNPPWLPETPTSPVEAAVYDPDSRMLRGFLAGLPAHLAPGGEAWLIISDIAELLGLRTRDELLGWIQDAGLRVVNRLDTRPQHPKAMDANDPLHAARSREVTSLWRLANAS